MKSAKNKINFHKNSDNILIHNFNYISYSIYKTVLKNILVVSVLLLVTVFSIILSSRPVKAQTSQYPAADEALLINDSETNNSGINNNGTENIVILYDSVKIAQGDTIELLADKYNTSGLISDSEYIEEIKRINHLYTDTIHAGCYLTIMKYRQQN